MATKSPFHRLLRLPLCTSCRTTLLKPSSTPFTRHLSSTPSSSAPEDNNPPQDPSADLLSTFDRATAPARPSQPTPGPGRFTRTNDVNRTSKLEISALMGDLNRSDDETHDQRMRRMQDPNERMLRETSHFHVYATKHNTHITVTDPQRRPLISLSAGNLGFRKANRGTYDAAYQLANYVMGRMRESGLMQSKIQYLEVILRGYGVGREAVSKSLMGVEGHQIREAIVRISDNTKLKFGGTRSRKPRRLG